MGSSHQDTTQSSQQSGTISPYAPTQDTLNGILGGVNGLLPSATQPNAAQTGAINTLSSNAQSMPNYGQAAQGVTGNLLTGGENYQPTVNSAYSQLQSTLSPIASASLDPMQTPGISGALDTVRNDVTNSVNGMFAGAGRDLSGMNQQTLARGIAQGEAPILLGQYNQNVANTTNAANGLLSGAQSTATTNSGLQQTQFGNQTAGVNMGINTVPTALDSNANQTLAAEAQRLGIPVQQLAQLAGITIPIAGLGKQYTGTSNGQSNTTSTPSLLSQIGQGAGIFGSLFS